MKRVLFIGAVFLCSVIGVAGCDKELQEIVDDFYEAAPGFCQEMC